MHSSANRAANGMSSARRACEDPNRSFISEARKEPRASAANAGNVIMHRGLNTRCENAGCFTIVMHQWSSVNSGTQLPEWVRDIWEVCFVPILLKKVRFY